MAFAGILATKIHRREKPKNIYPTLTYCALVDQFLVYIAIWWGHWEADEGSLQGWIGSPGRVSRAQLKEASGNIWRGVQSAPRVLWWILKAVWRFVRWPAKEMCTTIWRRVGKSRRRHQANPEEAELMR